MKAKDTVMNIKQREAFRLKCHKAVAAYLGKDIPDIRLSDINSKAKQICQDVALEELEAQAKISFKAGTEEERREIIQWLRDLGADEYMLSKLNNEMIIKALSKPN